MWSKEGSNGIARRHDSHNSTSYQATISLINKLREPEYHIAGASHPQTKFYPVLSERAHHLSETVIIILDETDHIKDDTFSTKSHEPTTTVTSTMSSYVLLGSATTQHFVSDLIRRSNRSSVKPRSLSPIRVPTL